MEYISKEFKNAHRLLERDGGSAWVLVDKTTNIKITVEKNGDVRIGIYCTNREDEGCIKEMTSTWEEVRDVALRLPKVRVYSK